MSLIWFLPSESVQSLVRGARGAMSLIALPAM